MAKRAPSRANKAPEVVVLGDLHKAISKGSPSQAEAVGLFMQCRYLPVIANGDVVLHADHSPQSVQPAASPEPTGTVVEVDVPMASLLIDCFLPVFLYIPITVQPC